MNMMTSKEHLTNLRRISKLFKQPIPYGRFNVTDPAHTTALEFIPSYECENTNRYDFSTFPTGLIKKENPVLQGETIFINGLALYPVNEGSVCNYNYNINIPNVDWEKYQPVRTKCRGSILKSLFSVNVKDGKDMHFRFVRDKDIAYIELTDWKNATRDKYLRYVLENYTSEYTTISSMFGDWQLRNYASLLPNDRDVSITFADDMLMFFEWQDDENNTYRWYVAPRITGD